MEGCFSAAYCSRCCIFFSRPVVHFLLFLSPFPSFLWEPLPCSHSLSLSLYSPLLPRSPLFPQSVELNLNDTLAENNSLSDLILLVSPFQRAWDMVGEFEWSVRDRDGRESSLVEYLKTTHPSASKGGTCIFSLHYICQYFCVQKGVHKTTLYNCFKCSCVVLLLFSHVLHILKAHPFN